MHAASVQPRATSHSKHLGPIQPFMSTATTLVSNPHDTLMHASSTDRQVERDYNCLCDILTHEYTENGICRERKQGGADH